MRKKALFISFLAVFSQLFIGPAAIAPAQAGWVDFFFPSLRRPTHDPTDTLQAPFADAEAQKEKDIKKGTLPVNNLPLEQPHRDYESISDWANTAVSESITFKAASLKSDLTHHKAHFSPTGWSEYSTFLKDTEILSTLQTGKYNLTGVIEAPPRLLNEGVVAGRYRWLYQVPVMLSYMDSNAEDYDKFEATNKYMQINLEVGRSDETQDALGIRIERWSGKAIEK